VGLPVRDSWKATLEIIARRFADKSRTGRARRGNAGRFELPATAGTDFTNLPFRPKSFRINFHPQILLKVSLKNDIYYYFDYHGQLSCFSYILNPCKVIITNLNLTKLSFIRKVRPKRFH
jgi:hypothetical protein